jgi:hypothetical protein
MEGLFNRLSIDASYQVSFDKLVSDEKIKMWKVNGQRTPSAGKSSHCLWQGDLKNTFLSVFLFLDKMSGDSMFFIWLWQH